jgi:Aromatic-ring-opening dioxygenase LigAB, LigA subunit
VAGASSRPFCFEARGTAWAAVSLRDEDGYCAKFGLTPEQRTAVARRNVLIEAGGNVYYLAASVENEDNSAPASVCCVGAPARVYDQFS